MPHMAMDAKSLGIVKTEIDRFVTNAGDKGYEAKAGKC